MEVSARKQTLIPPHKYSGYNTKSRVSVTGDSTKPPLGAVLNKYHIFTDRSFIQFLPRCRGQDIRLWPTSSVPCHSGRYVSLPQRGYQPGRYFRIYKQKGRFCRFLECYSFFFWLIAPYRRVMKPSGSSVGLPVSRRESRCCGGRRGGLNDSQHCAVGPGLQSPQRWSFPPASISLAVSLHSTRSSSSLSSQPFRYPESSTFIPVLRRSC